MQKFFNNFLFKNPRHSFYDVLSCKNIVQKILLFSFFQIKSKNCPEKMFSSTEELFWMENLNILPQKRIVLNIHLFSFVKKRSKLSWTDLTPPQKNYFPWVEDLHILPQRRIVANIHLFSFVQIRSQNVLRKSRIFT